MKSVASASQKGIFYQQSATPYSFFSDPPVVEGSPYVNNERHSLECTPF